jgi:dUTPase
MAQIIITLIGDMDLEELGADEKLPESDRGEYGFGSSGAC